MFMGAMPKIVKGVISLLGDDIHEGDVILHNDPVPRGDPLARRRDRDRRSSSTASSSASRAPQRTSSTSAARTPASPIDLVDNWSEGNIYRAVKLADKGVWQDGPLEAHPREHAHADPQPRRHPGDDRGLRAGQPPLRGVARALRQGGRARRRAGAGSPTPSGCCARRSRRCRTARYETDVGWLDDDGKQPRREAAGARSRS